MLDEVGKWPYRFPASKDFHQAEERGMISGKLMVYDRYNLLNFLCIYKKKQNIRGMKTNLCTHLDSLAMNKSPQLMLTSG